MRCVFAAARRGSERSLVSCQSHMPAAETLARFIALVEQNEHAEAIEAFYTVDASMQENQSAPSVGRDALAANERRILAKAKTVVSRCIRPIFVNGDNVVIRWTFHFEWLDEIGRAHV